jgi:membrane protein implicated in regulation of membrane protease activity
MDTEIQVNFLTKTYQSSIGLSVFIFFLSIAMLFIGEALPFPFDITLHGFILTIFGILSLYLYQDAVYRKSKSGFSSVAVDLVFYWLFAFIVLLLSTCLCELGEVKEKMVMISAPTIFVVYLLRTFRNQKGANKP